MLREENAIMSDSSSRTVLFLGVATVAGGLMAAASNAQAPAPAAAAPPPPTPRTADGHPDLNGIWVGTAVAGAFASDNGGPTFAGRGNSFVGFEADGGLWRMAGNTTTIPQYKPEFWDVIIENEQMGNWYDPVVKCLPLGVPRSGAPAAIFQTPGTPAMFLYYQSGFTGYGNSYQSWDTHRWVWMDGRPQDLLYAAQETSLGSSVAHWEGDTLVIETIGFTDTTWLHKNGYPHGFNMKVTERLTRTGNTLRWEATVEDPEYLTEPWVLTPVTRTLNADKNARLPQSQPCQELEAYGSPVRSG
jgi:hypothetical protein